MAQNDEEVMGTALQSYLVEVGCHRFMAEHWLFLPLSASQLTLDGLI